MSTVTEARSTLARIELTLAAMLLTAFAFALIWAAPAQAQNEPYSEETPRVLPTRIEQSDGEIAGVSTSRPNSGTLPFTGADITLFLVTGVAGIGTGALLLKRSRSA